jgi:cell division protein FtsB
MKAILVALVALLLLLQYRLWLGQGGLLTIWHLKQEIAEQVVENQTLKQRNNILLADIEDLKNGNEAVEERARNDLGMVKSGEHFYQVVATN